MNKDEIPERGARTTTPARVQRRGPRMASRDRFESAQVALSLSMSGDRAGGLRHLLEMGESVAIFQLDVPEKYLTQLKKDRHAVFLTALAQGDDQTIIQVEILVLNSKEFVYTETAIKDAANEADPRAITVPWVERK